MEFGFTGPAAETGPASEAAKVADDILGRAIWARNHNHDEPHGAWSVEEQLGVALALDNQDHLTSLGYSVAAALERLTADMNCPPPDANSWLAGIRARVSEHTE